MSSNGVGPENHNWRGGRSLASSGYMLVRVGVGHPLADVRGYAYEHRVVASKKIGRLVDKKEHVHHVNGDRTDNRPENLEVLTRAEHRAEHRTKQRSVPLQGPNEENNVVECACGCGTSFTRYDDTGRPRRFVPGHNARHDDPALAFAQRVLKDGPRALPDIAGEYPSGLDALRSVFVRLVAARHVVRVSRGVYGLPGTPVKAQPSNEPVGCACGCGQRMTPFDEYGRARRFLSGHNNGSRASGGRLIPVEERP